MAGSSLKISETLASDMSSRVADVTIDTKSVDSPMDQDETEWTNSKFTQQWGYFNSVPDLKTALLMKAIWNVGKGWTAEARTEEALKAFSGWGKDTFDDIIFNMEVMRRVCGDAYAEIIRDDVTNEIINLKPLNPGSMKHIVNRKGQLVRFEQISQVKGVNPKKFKPEDIFYLSNNRLADQIHGISDIDALEKTILADNQSFEDMNKIMHRQARPMIMFKVGTDDTSKIAAFVKKMDEAVNKGENIYIPDDVNSVQHEVIQVNVSQMLLEWRNDLRNRFFRAIGLPQIVPGAGGQSTESESKVIYLAFEQIVEREQKFIENQIWKQLNFKIDFYPPQSLTPSLTQDTAKDGMMQQMPATMNPAGVEE